MSEPPCIVAAGTSVRFLAQSLRRAGYRVAAADCFGDMDTRQAANALALAARGDARDLAAAASSLHPWGRAGAGLVWGSGFESDAGCLRRLECCFTLRGNSPFVAEVTTQPRRFFALLDALEIPYPEVAFEGRDAPDDSLIKHAASSGGLDVHRMDRRAWDAALRERGDAYLQRRVDGPVFSVVFAADGRETALIGLNTVHWGPRGGHPFAYLGAVSRFPLSAEQRSTVAGYVARLTRALGLRGVNGVDLVMDGSRPLLLELNPRPPATLELYENEFPNGALAIHLAACDGRLALDGRHDSGTVRGCRVVYAPEELTVPAVSWPDWARDRPAPGARIGTGTPLCSVHVEGVSAEVVETRLAACTAEVMRMMGAQARPAAA